MERKEINDEFSRRRTSYRDEFPMFILDKSGQAPTGIEQGILNYEVDLRVRESEKGRWWFLL